MSIDGGASGAPTTVSLNVKDGQQTFKWLAQVVASRCAVADSLSASRIVSEITNSKSEVVNPRDMIVEHADEDGNCRVRAALVPSFPSDIWGNPVYNDFLTAAYLRSEIGSQWSSEMHTWRQRLQAAVVDSSGKPIIMGDVEVGDEYPASQGARLPLSTSNGIGSSTNNLIQIGDEPDPSAAFELDWTQMRWTWLEAKSNTHHEVALRPILLEYYHIVISIFRHYCGSGYVGQRYGMTKSEFAHLLHNLNIVNLATPSGDDASDAHFNKVVEEQVASGSGGSGTQTHKLMSRAQFTQALVSVAISTSQDPLRATAESLLSFFSGPLSDWWQLICTSYSRYSISDPILPVHLAISDYYRLVQQAFYAFCHNDPDRGAEISLESYMQLLITSTLVFKDQHEPMIDCYLKAQQTLAPARDRELPALVYCEFLEAVSRLAIQIIDTDSQLGPGKRVRMAFSMITELQNHPMRREGGKK